MSVVLELAARVARRSGKIPGVKVMTEAELRARLAEIARTGEAWTYDIQLKDGVRTGDGPPVPHTRLRRVVQIAADPCPVPLNACRVLDLGCLEGQFAAEFALLGARVVGVEIREPNIRKARLVKEALGLEHLELVQDDARNVSIEKYGTFDIILCSGLLYHLAFPDIVTLVEQMAGMVRHLAIIDTHVSLRPDRQVSAGGRTYHGHLYAEHGARDSERSKADRPLASWGNDSSLWLTRPSLVNLLAAAGFSSVFECLNPPHLNFGRPGIESGDRCTFVALNRPRVTLATSPVVNDLHESWPEGALSYVREPAGKRPPATGGSWGRVVHRLLDRLRGRT